MIESRVGNMRKGLLDLVAFIHGERSTLGMTLIEVGTYKGDSAVIFADHFKRVTCIDAWEDALFNVPGTTAKDAERVLDERVRVLANVGKIKGRSLDVALDASLVADVVYVDASHDYASVRDDLRAWKSHAQSYICGHDYWPSRFPGVVKAVNEVLGKPFKIFCDTSWLVRVA